MGLMIGIELKSACAEIRNELLMQHKILTGSSSNKYTLRILPALNIKKTEADIFVHAFKNVMHKELVKS